MTEKRARQTKSKVRALRPLKSVWLLAALALTGCHSAGNHTEEGARNEDSHESGVVVFTHEQAEACGVEVNPVEMRSLGGVINCAGTVTTPQGSERIISAPLAGVVSFTGVTPTSGTAVSAGQTLFSISARNIQQSDQSAEMRANAGSARAALARAKEQFDARLITKAEYDAAVAEANRASAALRDPGLSPRKHATASSPISGYVTECLVRPGDFVEMGAPLAVISTTGRLQLQADVPQSYAAELPSVTSANILLPYAEGEAIDLSKFNSRIVSYGKAATGGLYVPMLIEFDNPGGLTAGAPVEVRLLRGGGTDAVVVPRSALTEEEGIYFVYVETSDEHFRKQRVQTGANDGVNVQILSGLGAGDRVVTKGATLLKLAANSGKAPEGHSHNH